VQWGEWVELVGGENLMATQQRSARSGWVPYGGMGDAGRPTPPRIDCTTEEDRRSTGRAAVSRVAEDEVGCQSGRETVPLWCVRARAETVFAGRSERRHRPTLGDVA
jgi:hypothetical protein